jgi:UDP:flavonoid glycosyltransferase YjiC (YdhE family)
LVDSDYLTACFGWWHQTFSVRQPSLVVCDYAPVAQWTARCMGIPVVSVGIALSQPPPSLTEFPLLLPDHDGWRYSEAALVASVNTATRPLGFRPLERLAQLHEADHQFLMSFPVLDPYEDSDAGRSHYSPVEGIGDAMMPDAGGDEVFIYFSTTETLNSGLMSAIETLDMPVTAYMPVVDRQALDRMHKAGVRMLDTPATAKDIKRRSRLMLHAGQHGILSLGMALGLPQFAVPQQLEQLFNSRQAAASGGTVMPVRTGIGADEFRAAIREAYFSSGLAEAALRQQAAVQPFVKAGVHEALARIVAGLA